MPTDLETVADGVQRLTGGSGGFSIGDILMAPFRAIGGFFSGAFGGIFSGAMWLGLPLFGLLSFSGGRDLVTGLLRQINNPQLTEWVQTHLLNPNLSWSQRLMWAGGIGAGLGGGLGGLWNAITSVFGGNQEPSRGDEREQSNGGGMGWIGGLAITAAVVGIGAVLVTQVQNNGDTRGPDGPPAGPRPGVAPRVPAEAMN